MYLLLLSFIRTIVPAIVGAVVGFLTTLGLEVDKEFAPALTTVLGILFTGLYYLIVRVIEMKLPQVGILLGYAKSPDSYSKGLGVDVASKNESSATLTVNNPVAELNSSVVSNSVDKEIYVSRKTPGPDHLRE